MKFFLAMALLFTGACHGDAFLTQNKLYIDDDSFKVNMQGDEFYIHVGDNVWLQTHTVHRDASGLFAYESELITSEAGFGKKMEYEKKWKCPYCFKLWPMKKPCGNSECPSKF